MQREYVQSEFLMIFMVRPFAEAAKGAKLKILPQSTQRKEKARFFWVSLRSLVSEANGR
jgi:hypothetical protein